MQHWAEREKGERLAQSAVLQYPTKALKHHKEWYALADTLLDAMDLYVVNPRNLQATSLKEVDHDWVVSYGRYRRGMQFHRDLRKRS